MTAPLEPAAPSRYTRQRRIPPLVWPLLAFAIIILLNASLFFRFEVRNGRLQGSLIDVVDNSAQVTLVALGMTLVIATGGIDLSVGAIMAISGTVAALLISQHHQPVPIAIAVAIATGLAAGAWNGFLVALLGVQPLVATLVLMIAGRGIAQLMSDGQHVPVSNPMFDYIGGGITLGLPFSIWLSMAMLLLIAIATRRTAAGLFIESVGDNPVAARFAGVNERGVKFSVYVISGLCSALAGLMYASDIREADAVHAGLYIELDAILAVVIGGTALAGGRFSLVGSVIGALIVQAVTTTILTRGIQAEMTQVVKAVVVVAVALLQAPVFVGMVTKPFRRKAAA